MIDGLEEQIYHLIFSNKISHLPITMDYFIIYQKQKIYNQE